MSYHAFLQIGIYVILIVGFAFVALMAIRPLYLRRHILQKGALIEGCIIEHQRDFAARRVGEERPYGLLFSYEYQGTSYTQRVEVTKETYLAYSDGTKIRVRCMPDAPTKAAPVDFDFWSGYG
jgi:hypothetical protein